MTEESSDDKPDGPSLTLQTDGDGQVEQVVLGETTIVEDVGSDETVDLRQALYEAGFELTTRSLDSFLTEVPAEEADDIGL